jgi:copper transport protein
VPVAGLSPARGNSTGRPDDCSSVRHLTLRRDPAVAVPAGAAGLLVRRSLSALLVVCAALGGLLFLDVLTARPASAHASVVTTNPADGARLDSAPDQVTIQFNEHVSLGAGYARVLDGKGGRVDTGAATVRDDVVTVPLRTGLPDAGYVVTYRVVSADSHPVSGAFSFVVGNGTLPAAGSVGTGDKIDRAVAVLLPLARWLGYVGLTLAVGIPVTLLTCWPAGWAAPRLRRAARFGLGAIGLGAVLSLLVQGPYAAASGLGSMLDPALLGATLDSEFGRTLIVRIVLTALLAVVLVRGWRSGGPSTVTLALIGVLGAGLVVAVAAVGHPVAGTLPGLAVAVSSVHVAAMASWLGGLFVLFAAALRAETPAGELDSALSRWSRLAGGYIAALVVTGVLQSVREVGTFSALVHTSYGWVLLAKLAVVLFVLVAALVSRDWVQQRAGAARRSGRRVVAQAFSASDAAPDAADEDDVDDSPVSIGVLRRSVLVELVGAVVVLALSAVLVSQYPAKASIATPVDVTLPLQSANGSTDNGSVEVTVDPAEPGPTTVHVFLFDAAGQPTQPQDIAVGLSETQQQIGPLAVDLAPAGPGHYTAEPVLPAAGTWTLTVTVRLDEFTAVTASTVFPVH